jgi:2,4-dienoyl-CoA reductase-like NADH-dependent reductase (Old Yellow Enzyme family)
LSIKDIEQIIADYKQAAINAMAAGYIDYPFLNK